MASGMLVPGSKVKLSLSCDVYSNVVGAGPVLWNSVNAVGMHVIEVNLRGGRRERGGVRESNTTSGSVRAIPGFLRYTIALTNTNRVCRSDIRPCRMPLRSTACAAWQLTNGQCYLRQIHPTTARLGLPHHSATAPWEPSAQCTLKGWGGGKGGGAHMGL